MLGGSPVTSTTFSGSIVDGGIGGGTGGSIVKMGAGTTTLSGTNTYTGTTAVNGGTLLITGSVASNLMTVNTGGTLAFANGASVGGVMNNGAVTITGGRPTC